MAAEMNAGERNGVNNLQALPKQILNLIETIFMRWNLAQGGSPP